MTVAVLAMAYGTPSSPDDVLSFYTDVRRGRPPSAEQLADLERRYLAIGGISPLRERTEAQIAGLQRALDARAPGTFATFYGSKHSTPKIEQQIATIASQGYRELVGLVLAPHYSALSVGEYIERASDAAKAHDIASIFIERWGTDETFIELLAERLGEAIEKIAMQSTNFEVVFSAHSLPARILEFDDPYPDELAETAGLVAHTLGLKHYRTGWQSAGRTPDPWLGPDLLVLFEQLQGERFDGVVVCPAGFTSDHLEVLYDLDIEASNRARDLGMAFVRTRSLNDDAKMADLLAVRIIAAENMLHRSDRPK
ncbi:MAG TPA: ferrochelatase [Acidimicrobiales bacterium]|nr:ferrochelatase [Acidimicrobiales bacterium]